MSSKPVTKGNIVHTTFVSDKQFWKLHRFFVVLDKALSSFPETVQISEEDTFHHMAHVMRMKPGNNCVLVDGNREVAYLAQVESVEKKSIHCQVLEKLNSDNLASSPIPEKIPNIILGAALIKENYWDLLIQKTTELGVRSITPLITQHTVVSIKDPGKKQARWNAIARRAAEQSEGLFLPAIEQPFSVKAFCEAQASVTSKFLLLERDDDRKPLKQVLPDHANSENIVAVIGPEGGWASEEIELFLAEGFIAVSLGDRVCRSETAAMAFMSAINYEFTSQ